MRLCSACLLGMQCRYDGAKKPDRKTVLLSEKESLISVCPEQLGGLSTPREPSEKKGDMVILKSGRDVTENFKKGAEETLNIAKTLKITQAILKQRSAACGCGEIYDGTFSGKIVKGNGVTTELLRRNGIEVISEEDLT